VQQKNSQEIPFAREYKPASTVSKAYRLTGEVNRLVEGKQEKLPGKELTVSWMANGERTVLKQKHIRGYKEAGSGEEGPGRRCF